MGNATQLNEVTLLNLETGAWRNLTNLSANVAGWSVGRPEPYQWSSTDGTPIEGILIKPAAVKPEPAGNLHPRQTEIFRRKAVPAMKSPRFPRGLQYIQFFGVSINCLPEPALPPRPVPVFPLPV